MKSIEKIAVAVDSFKGSLTSAEVADSVREGIHRVLPGCEVVKIPVADGGEGLVESLVESQVGRYVHVVVNDPLMRPVKARYGLIDDGRTAVIEMSAASGLPLLAPEERNPLLTSTFGTGEMILDALSRGVGKLLVGIGGSATNDGGMGMLRALGYRFTDSCGNELEGRGADLERVEIIDASGLDPRLKDVDIEVACDVSNPLCGPLGAAYVYAAQKGATPEDVARLDTGLSKYGAAVLRFSGCSITALRGAGAAGGLGGGMKALLGARLVNGVDLVLDAMKFDERIAGCDLVITGEGKMDCQTLMGKTPIGVLRRATAAGIPVIAVCGAVDSTPYLQDSGFVAIFPTVPAAVPLKVAMESNYASINVARTVEQIIRLMTLRKS